MAQSRDIVTNLIIIRINLGKGVILRIIIITIVKFNNLGINRSEIRRIIIIKNFIMPTLIRISSNLNYQ